MIYTFLNLRPSVSQIQALLTFISAFLYFNTNKCHEKFSHLKLISNNWRPTFPLQLFLRIVHCRGKCNYIKTHFLHFFPSSLRTFGIFSGQTLFFFSALNEVRVYFSTHQVKISISMPPKHLDGFLYAHA